MGQICCPETSVSSYYSKLRYIPEERRSHQRRSGNLKSWPIRSVQLMQLMSLETLPDFTASHPSPAMHLHFQNPTKFHGVTSITNHGPIFSKPYQTPRRHLPWQNTPFPSRNTTKLHDATSITNPTFQKPYQTPRWHRPWQNTPFLSRNTTKLNGVTSTNMPYSRFRHTSMPPYTTAKTAGAWLYQIASPLDTASSNNHDWPKWSYYYAVHSTRICQKCWVEELSWLKHVLALALGDTAVSLSWIIFLALSLVCPEVVAACT
jgi:hypothetical protein